MNREHGLGRRFQPDPDDSKFLLRRLVPQASDRVYRYWNSSGWWGNQGKFPHCVGYAWAHWLEDGPVGHTGPAPVFSPISLYHEAQKIDEWAGEAYDGTSVRAGAKILQQLGYITSYHWAWDLATLVDAVLERGPVVVGTDWHSDMDTPDAVGMVKDDGPVLGGHAWIINGVNKAKGRFRAKNSWGRSWGRRGTFWVPFEVMERLIDHHGEVCLAVETRP